MHRKSLQLVRAFLLPVTVSLVPRQVCSLPEDSSQFFSLADEVQPTAIEEPNAPSTFGYGDPCRYPRRLMQNNARSEVRACPEESFMDSVIGMTRFSIQKVRISYIDQ